MSASLLHRTYLVRTVDLWSSTASIDTKFMKVVGGTSLSKFRTTWKCYQDLGGLWYIWCTPKPRIIPQQGQFLFLVGITNDGHPNCGRRRAGTRSRRFVPSSRGQQHLIGRHPSTGAGFDRSRKAH